MTMHRKMTVQTTAYCSAVACSLSAFRIKWDYLIKRNGTSVPSIPVSTAKVS